MAKAAGLSVSSVQRIWRAHGLQPHRMRQFKLSNDPRFVDKLRDVVGLYVDPPAHAIVLSVDEKSQIQALDRTQPGLPLKKGRAGTMTHDYVRHGTTTLFAAMNVLDGTVIGCNMQRHRHQEFIRFLNVIEKQVPAGKTIHAIIDNYAAHKHPNVRRWLGHEEPPKPPARLLKADGRRAKVLATARPADGPQRQGAAHAPGPRPDAPDRSPPRRSPSCRRSCGPSTMPATAGVPILRADRRHVETIGEEGDIDLHLGLTPARNWPVQPGPLGRWCVHSGRDRQR
jgi:hypothetical protein